MTSSNQGADIRDTLMEIGSFLNATGQLDSEGAIEIGEQCVGCDELDYCSEKYQQACADAERKVPGFVCGFRT